MEAATGAIKFAGDEDELTRTVSQSTRPATASSFFNTAGSRASGAVISA
jgi:hypothetical protein